MISRRTAIERAEMRDAIHAALGMTKDIADPGMVVGYGVAELRDEATGRLKLLVPFANLVTTAGDQYLANRVIFGINSNGVSAPTAASGMKLGTGTTAVAKSGAGAALVTYITGSNNPLDATYPTAASAGGDTGWNTTYRTSWAAGDVTNSAIAECVLVNDAGTDATSTAANTYSRVTSPTWTAINKTATDSLIVTWSHKLLGQ